MTKVRLFTGLTLAILILAAVHVFLSLNFKTGGGSGSGNRLRLLKISFVWLLSLFMCIAMLVLSIVALKRQEKEEFTDVVAQHQPKAHMSGGRLGGGLVNIHLGKDNRVTGYTPYNVSDSSFTHFNDTGYHSMQEAPQSKYVHQKWKKTLEDMHRGQEKIWHRHEREKTKLQREQIKAENSIRRALGKQNIIIKSAASGIESSIGAAGRREAGAIHEAGRREAGAIHEAGRREAGAIHEAGGVIARGEIVSGAEQAVGDGQ